MANTKLYDTSLREEIYSNFGCGKVFSPFELAELVNRDLRSVRTSLQRFTRANFVVRNKRGEYVLNDAHPQVIKLSGVAAPTVPATEPNPVEAAVAEVTVESAVTA